VRFRRLRTLSRVVRNSCNGGSVVEARSFFFRDGENNGRLLALVVFILIAMACNFLLS